MRSTLLFITLLLFVSCTKDMLSPSVTKSALVQLSSKPKAEAVFATVAVHLKDGDHGFNKILSLLTGLVNSAKEEAHKNRMLYKSTEERCRIGVFSLNERQAYFDGVVNTMNVAKTESERTEAESSNLLNSRNQWLRVFRTMGETQLKRVVTLTSALKAGNDEVDEGVKRISVAIEAVNNWAAANGTAFVQKSLEAVSDSYMKIKKMRIIVPSNLLQRSGSPQKVKARLLEWLNELHTEFQVVSEERHQLLTGVSEHGNMVAHSCDELANSLENDAKAVTNNLAVAKAVIENVTVALAQFTTLAADNHQLLSTVVEWCAVEKSNFEKVDAASVENIKLFQEVREYFVDHYKEISNYIMEKYQ